MQVPDAQVILVGTHVDHPSLSRSTLEQIWHQLRQLLSEARCHHQRYFKHADRLPRCLLCQTDPQCSRRSDCSDQIQLDDDGGPSQSGKWFINHAFDAGDATQQSFNQLHGSNATDDVSESAASHSDDDNDAVLTNGLPTHEHSDKRTLMFPHVLGYYEVSCTSGQGVGHLRDAVTELASQLIASNPQIPRRWLNVERSLVARDERSGSVCTLDELKDIAAVQGVSDPQDVLNMIHFFRAQGRILYFPQVSAL